LHLIQRIFHAISEISNTSKDDDVGFLIIDDTLSKKDISTKHIEGLDFHNSHADGNKLMWSHCLVTSHYTINDYSIPLNSISAKKFLRIILKSLRINNTWL
jgi:hypothetical protein